MSERLQRTLLLPAAGAESLRTALGVLTDQGFVDPHLNALDASLYLLWPNPTSEELSNDLVRPFALAIVDADLLLGALRVTEMLSMEFPWYDQLVETIQFIGDQLIELWTKEEWIVFRDGHPSPRFT